MKDKIGTIIYVGKAKNLRNRLRQYFQTSEKAPKVEAMVENIEEFEYIIVENEIESLILEQNLIKEKMPKYNILLKDDKQYPCLKINLKDKYPRLIKTRSVRDDGSIYFGPYASAFAVNESLEFLSSYFRLRSCGLNLNKKNVRKRPCLNYYIEICDAPCVENISEEEYKKRVSGLISFLDGKHKIVKEVLDYVKSKMEESAKNLNFEKAAYYRNLDAFLKNLLEKQNVESMSFVDKDVIAMARDGEEVCIQIFFVRAGKVLGREHYMLKDTLESENKDILSAFIKQFYTGYANLPNEIILEEEIDEIDSIEKYLSNIKNKTVRIIIPKRGENIELISLVKKNANDMLVKHADRYLKKNKENMETLDELKSILNLKSLPLRIEVYDISHIAGVESVGSMVVFEKGASKNSDYRKFRIKNSTNDDYKSLEEVLTRRFERLKLKGAKNESFKNLPDLIIMDGGKGQVNIALKVLENFDLEIPVCGLAKNEFHQTRAIIYEGEEFLLNIDSNLYRMLYKMQEEAHRFAINYHRARMSNRFYKSELDDIEGIGPKRKQALINHFKSIERIENAEIEELKSVDGMNEKSAKAVYEYFRRSYGKL